jgi:predicted PurR-regulated permease PerM
MFRRRAAAARRRTGRHCGAAACGMRSVRAMTNRPHGGISHGPADEAVGNPPAEDPFVVRVSTVLALTALALIAAVMVVKGAGVLLAAFGGVLLAILLNAVADRIAAHTPLPYLAAFALIVVLILAVIGGGTWLLAPQVAEQIDQLGEKLPEMVAEVESFLQQYGWGQWLIRQAGNGAMEDGAMAGGVGVLSALSSASTYALVTIFVGLFAAANPRMYTDGIVSLAPMRQRARVREMLQQLGHTLRWWLVGQAATMSIIGVSTGLMLWAFGVPLALVVGLIVGLLGFIPYLGPIAGLLPVAMIAATQGATTLLYVLIAYFVLQMLEGYVAVPLVHERTVYLPPVFTIIIQILLGTVLGVMGVVLATPLAAVILVLTRFYQRDFLGDPEAAVEAA